MLKWVNPHYNELDGSHPIKVPSLRLVFSVNFFDTNLTHTLVQSVNILRNHGGRGGGIPNDYMITGGGGGLKRAQK